MEPFDDRHLDLKLRPAVKRLHEEAGKCWARARAEVKVHGNHARLFPAFIDCQMEALRKYLEEVDRVCREVQLLDGNAVTPEFIRGVLSNQISNVIAARKGSIQGDLELTVRRLNVTGTDLTRSLAYLSQEISVLVNELATRYEVETTELAKRDAQARRTTQSLPPPEVLGGAGIAQSYAKPTEVPQDLPMYFPGELWPQTQVILLEAQRKFPFQTGLLEFCKRVIAKMKPIFVEAVKAGKMTGNAVLTKGHGGMSDLFHSLLVYNDPGRPASGLSSLSEQASELGKTVRKSEEWRALTRAIAKAERLRTRGKPQNSAPTRNSDKTEQSLSAGGIVQEDGKKSLTWREIDFTFLSDERVQVCVSGDRKTYNYAEFGFEDRRNGTPSRAWAVLREMAKNNGTIPRPSPGKDRTMIQKRIEEIREKLQAHFKIQADPIPFNGEAYQASFKTSRQPSFDK